MSEAIDQDRDVIAELSALVDLGQSEAVVTFFRLLPPEETAWTISHVDDERRTGMFKLLASGDPVFAADLLEHFDDWHAAEIMADLPPAVAAVIVDEMDSDEQADVLNELHEDDAAAILKEMSPEEAIDTRRRLRYEHDSAGGLMITEYLFYPATQTVEAVAEDLRHHGEDYGDFEARYVFATDQRGGLAGVVPMRRLVMARFGTRLATLVLDETVTVNIDTHVDEMEDIFDRLDLMALPVLDEAQRLVGIVQRAAVQEWRGDAAEEDLAKSGGILGGEELRHMPTLARAMRRLAFLFPIMLLMMVSAGVISLFRGTVAQVPVIAAFLPLVAGLCGSGGNQAVAVSMREISLGLIKPADFWRVAGKELSVALIIGLVLGTMICVIVAVWEHNWALGLIIGGAVPTTVVAAGIIGGGVPLALRMAKLDPAMASGPVVTTLIDLLAYFTVLSLASLAIGAIGQAG